MWGGEQGNIQVEEAKGVSRRKQSSTCQIWMSKEQKIRHGKIQNTYWILYVRVNMLFLKDHFGKTFEDRVILKVNVNGPYFI